MRPCAFDAPGYGAYRARSVSRYETRELDPTTWTDHDVEALRKLGFDLVGRVDDGAQSVAVLARHDPETWALLYEGTPYVEYHSVFGRGFAVVTTDTPLRVDEFGEHEGQRERKTHLANHRFLPPDELLEAHRTVVEETAATWGPPRPVGPMEGAVARLRALEGKRSIDDYRSLLLIASVFVGTIALAVAALAYFGD